VPTKLEDIINKALEKDRDLRYQVASWLPTIRAQVALVNQQPQQAIDMLQAAVPVELGASLSTQGPPCLYPVYVRGEAYLAAGQGSAAAAEFQKLIDHRGITWSCTTGHWRGWDSAGPMRCLATRPKRRLHTRTS